MSTVLAPDLLWTERGFQADVQVELGADGRIAAVGKALAKSADRLAGRALLPGFVAAHSHAFQRALRGRGERFPAVPGAAGGGSFWSWREEMYAAIESLDREALARWSAQAFREMLAAGITTVGEFHYLHHDASGAGWTLDRAILDAARETGIRLVLLETFYATGGIGRPLAGSQRRFAAGSPMEYWRAFDRLKGELDARTQSLGAAVHSIRAATLPDLEALRAEARARGLVFHMHVEEQRKEVEDCTSAHGEPPMALLLERSLVDERFTAVHCTHTRAGDLEAFAAAGGSVCVTPLTEANLGDGIQRWPRELVLAGRLALGTDSNARISMVEEMRWLEYAQRLASESRGLLADRSGAVAPVLLAAATSGGARSLGLDTGAIRPGALADFVELDLGAEELAGWTADSLLESLVFGGGERSIAASWVGGKRVHERQG